MANDYAYNTVMRIEENKEKAIIEIYPGIHCLNETRNQIEEYIRKINDQNGDCYIRISLNGYIYVRTELCFKSSPITVAEFRSMELVCLIVLNMFESVIEKISPERLFKYDEAYVEWVD